MPVFQISLDMGVWQCPQGANQPTCVSAAPFGFRPVCGRQSNPYSCVAFRLRSVTPASVRLLGSANPEAGATIALRSP